MVKKNKTNNIKQTKGTKTKKTINENSKKNTILMKVLVALGVILLCAIVIYLMNYFFVEKSYIKINISTDKHLEYITVDNKEELITTQKYVSDLNYSMRYDINTFKVFKYKEQDIFRFLDNEKILILVEKSNLPNKCSETTLEMEYNNCVINVDNYTEEFYISQDNQTYKLTVKSINKEIKGLQSRIDYMLDSFEIN